jgi:hypothetical protein
MKKTVLTYGFISGGIAAVLMLATLPFMEATDGQNGAVVGYTGIVLSMLLVFFGVRSYRENVGAGKISFGRAFTVGILITLISCTCYVATWELIYFKLAPEFGAKCLAAPVNKLKASGAPQEKIDEAQRQLDTFKKLYDNPLANAAITYIEPFPVGLLISAITALILRRKSPQTA